jgi:hypothetical protein
MLKWAHGGRRASVMRAGRRWKREGMATFAAAAGAVAAAVGR